MTPYLLAAAIWLLGFARTACYLDRPQGLRLAAAMLWPVVSIPCLFHLPETVRRWGDR